MGGPNGEFDLLFPLTDKIMYYASVFSLPEVLYILTNPLIACLDGIQYTSESLPFSSRLVKKQESPE
jgi:hypothetical protein